MLHPEIIENHSQDCKALEAVRAGTLTNPWLTMPIYDLSNECLIYRCTGCKAQMKVSLKELADYSNTYVDGIFE